MKQILVLLTVLILFNSNIFSQSAISCDLADPFCTGVTYGFPMGVGSSAEVGPDYGCLMTQPNPVWYYLLIDQPGNINIYMESPTGNDIDFIAWGPFSSNNYICNNLSAGNTIDCSYSTSQQETCDISNALTGQYYMLCITNYSNAAGNIVFSQLNTGQPGAGSTNCSCCYSTCIFGYMMTQNSTCDTNTNLFTLTGTVFYNNIIDTGFVTITPPQGPPTILNADSNNSQTFTIPNQIADGQSQHLHFTYNNDLNCTGVFSYNAPVPCIDCYVNAGHDDEICGFTYQMQGTNISGYNSIWTCDSAGVTIQNPNLSSSLVQVSHSGNYTFKKTNISPTNDTCFDYVTILFKKIPTSTFTVNPTSLLCEHDSLHVVYTGVCSPSAQFNWVFNPSPNTIQGSVDNDFWLNYPVSGTKSIKLTVMDNGCTSTITTIQKFIPSGYSLNATVGASNCTTGTTQTVQVYASGSYPPFTYSWSNVTGPPFSAGTYTVTSTDTHGCNETSTFAVDSSAFSLTTNFQNLTCYNNASGLISILASGGTPPYSYLWANGLTNDTISNLQAGNHLVTVTDQAGCTLTHTVTLTQPTTITISRTITNVICFNDCNGKITSSATGGILPYTYLWSTGETTSYTDSLCPGLYNVTVKDNNNCTSIQTNISVANHADMVIAMPSSQSDCNSTCNGVASVTNVLNAYTPVTYQWSNGSTGASQDSLCAGNYTVTVIDYKWCTKTATKTINSTTGTVIINNVINDSISCITGCSGAIVASASGGVYPYVYHLGALTNTTGTFNNICPGNYSVWAADSNNCVSNSNFIIQGLPAVVANAGPDQTICTGNSITLTATGGVSYVWSPSPAQQSVPFINNTTRYYYVTVTDANGCTGIDNVLVTVKNLSAANAGIDQTKCKDNNISTLSGATNTTGGIWSGGTGIFTPNNTALNATYTPTITELNSGFVILTLTTTDNGPCSAASDQMTINYTNAPTVNAGIDQTKCANNSATTLSGTVSIATGGIWSGGVGTFNPNTNTLNAIYTPTASEIASGSKTLTLTTTGNGVCAAKTDQITINFTPAPTSNAGADLNICSNSPVLLNGFVTSATGGLWTGGNGTYIPNSNTLDATYTPTAAEISSGITNLTLTTTGNGNCLATSDIMSINYNPEPIANAGSDITICYGDSVTLSATGGINYVWDNSVIQGQSFTPNISGIYTVTVTNSYGCTKTDQVNITITPLPIAEAGSNLTICEGNTVILTASGGSNYQWSTSVIQGQPFIPTISGNYTVTVTNNFCSSIDSLNITLIPLPIINAGPDMQICYGESIILNATGGINYIWDPVTIEQGIPFTPTSSQTYTVSASDASGCTSSDNVFIDLTNPTININEVSDTLISEGPYLLINCNTQWYDSNGIIPGAISGIFIPDYTSNFYVISNCNGCIDTSEVINFIYTKKTEIKTDLVIIYPNPANNEITIEKATEFDVITLSDESGKVLQKINIENKNKLNISLKNYSSGAYIIQLSGKNKNTVNKTILKQ